MIQKIYSNLFFFFFVAQIFSPYIFGVTIYLEFIVAILNPLFWKWAFMNKRDFLQYLLILIMPLLFLKITMSIKLLSLIISVAYLFYTYKIRQFYLFRYLTLSILVATAQFVLFYIRPELSIMIGPNNIANMIWGEYATPTFTNFYEVMIGIIRVSGLSREAGFFASLLICSIIFYYLDKRKKDYYKWLPLLLGIGYIISFSKMSLLLVPIFMIIWKKKWIDWIHPLIAIFLFFVIMIIFWYHSDYLIEEEHLTFTHRFGAYGILADINDLQTFLFGNSELTPRDFDGNYSRKCIKVLDDLPSFAGMGGYIITNGVVLTLLLLILLTNLQITTTGIIVLLLLTLNVQLDTNQNFVTLAYFIVLKFFKTNNYFRTNVLRRSLIYSNTMGK